MNHLIRARRLVTAALLAFASLAQAQYVWINDKGVKEYSDRSPPASVPLKNILKAPNGQPTAASLPAAQAAEAANPKTAPTLAERDADYNKRLKDKADQDKQDKEAQDTKAALAQICERARAAKRSLDSGARIRTADSNGERTFMSDEQRAAESKKADQVLAACKS